MNIHELRILLYVWKASKMKEESVGMILDQKREVRE